MTNDRYKRWKSDEARALLDGIGSFGWSALERRTGHTRAEIWAKVRREFGGGGITRGSYSLREAMDETGYSRSQLERAAEALNQRWARTARGGDYLITAEQIEDMANWLAKDFWCAKHHLYGCMNCESAEREHHSLGLCFACYQRVKRFVRRTLKIRFTPGDLLDFFQKPVVLSKADALFLEHMKVRLEGGRCPSIADLERAISLCNP